MRHATCRRALLDGDLNPDVAAHLDRCEACRTFSRDLALVGELAESLAPPPPPAGLTDRVVDAVRGAGDAERESDEAPDETSDEAPAAAPPPPPWSPPPPSPPPAPVVDLTREVRRRRRPAGPGGDHRTPLLVSTAAAAVLLLLVGVLAAVNPVDGDRGSEVADPLLAAAERTLGIRSARLHLEGTAEARVQVPPEARAFPDLELEPSFEPPEPPALEPPPPPELPDEMPPEMREEILRSHDQQVAEMRRLREQMRRDQREHLDRLRRDARQAFSELDIPDRLSFEARITGEGMVSFPDRLRVDGRFDVVRSEPELPDLPGGFALVVDDGSTYYRGPDGTWIRIPGPSGPLGPMVVDPDGVANLLGGASGEARDLGREEIDGTEVRHYRFAVDPGAFGSPEAEIEATADVWVGEDDGVVRRLTTRATSDFEDPSGFRGTYRTEVTLRLSDFGGEAAIDVPEAAGRSSSPFGPGALLAPYDRGFATSFFYGAELPEMPEPPELPELPAMPQMPDMPAMPMPPELEGMHGMHGMDGMEGMEGMSPPPQLEDSRS